jgi:uncharacterized membrane protein
MKRVETDQERHRRFDWYWELGVFAIPFLWMPPAMFLIRRYVYVPMDQMNLMMGTILLFFGWMGVGCSLRVNNLNKEIARMKRENEEDENEHH